MLYKLLIMIILYLVMNIKFISTLFEQFKTIRKSMAYRGIPYNSGNIIKSFKLMFMPAIRLSYSYQQEWLLL